MQEAVKNLPKFDAESMANAKYYKGGFDPKMNRREASLILGEKYTNNTLRVFSIYDFKGINPSANKNKVKDAFKKVMAANHPDRGGSPYIASKINEAKDFMEKNS